MSLKKLRALIVEDSEPDCVLLLRELGKAGYPTRQTEPVAAGALVLDGKVTVGRTRNGVQAVAIAWTMRAADGKVVGTARQASQVPAGSLDGSWGITAISVAQAVVPAIVRMAQQAVDAGTSAKR